jgi:hypothetical protein
MKIGYALAKLASEKGFAHGSRFFYEESGKLVEHVENVVYINSLSENVYECPEQLTLKEWLFTEHKLNVSVFSTDFEKFTYVITSEFNLLRESNSKYPTQQEALENGLELAFNLISEY